jgi:hypothetical protein
VPRKKTAHAELDEHRQRVAAEGMKFREAQSRLEATKAKLEDCSRALTDAYAAEDQKLARERREELKREEAEVVDCQHRVGGAELRARRAREELDAFLAASAGVLLGEREDTAKRVAAELTRAVAEVVRARRAYDAERSHVDDLVSKLPGASPRHDGRRRRLPLGGAAAGARAGLPAGLGGAAAAAAVARPAPPGDRGRSPPPAPGPPPEEDRGGRVMALPVNRRREPARSRPRGLPVNRRREPTRSKPRTALPINRRAWNRG